MRPDPQHRDPGGAAAGWPVYADAPPFLRAEWREGCAVVTGQPACELGRPVAGADGGEEGVFARWHWDGSRLTAQTDPLGFFSLFVYCKGPVVAVSPSPLQLLATGADPEADRRALAVFYRLGLFINDDTPFRHIHTLPPGGRLVWEAGTAKITGGPHIPRQAQITRDAAVDGFIDLPRQTLARMRAQWPGAFLMPLSGGRDSRHILLELVGQKAPPAACVTFQHEAGGLNPESSAARAICESVGVRHLILGHPRARARDILRALVLTGLCSDEHAQMMPLHDFLTGRPEAALDGIGGDILTNPDDDAEAYFRQAQAGDFAGIARDLCAGHARVITRRGDRGPGDIYAADRGEEAIAYLADTIAGFADAADPYQAFWFWNRTRREVSFVTSAMLGGAGAVFCPYLDRQFVEFSLALPYAVTRDQMLHDDAIARAFPAYRHIPFAESMLAARPRSRGFFSRARQATAGLRVLAALRPARPVREGAAYLTGSDSLHRRPAEILQQHALALDGMSAQKASRLLALARDFRAADSGYVVSDTVQPDRTDAG